MKPIFIQGRDLLFGGALSLAAIVFGTQAGSLVYSHTHGNETIGGNRLANTQLAMNQDWPEIAPELVFMNELGYQVYEVIELEPEPKLYR